MPLNDKTDELARLVRAFEAEAAKFYPLGLSLLYVTQDGPSQNRSFARPNHAIMLWQYYGPLDGCLGAERLFKDLSESDMKWGVRGAEITCAGVLEGDGCDLFVRMAQRSGSLFDENEATVLNNLIVGELLASEKKRHGPAKPTAVSNSNPLAIWINYLLFHLSLTNPGRERATKIEPDPFTLSLLALERLQSDRAIRKVDKSSRRIEDLNFQVAMSFSGERRAYVASVVNALQTHLPPDSIFYDHDYQAQLARPNMDVLLQDVYRNRSKLVVVYLCEKYAEKQWCGLEWRAVRDLIKVLKSNQVMFVRFDDSTIDGVLSIDGYIDARLHDPSKVAEFILQRIESVR